jgi:hypothetical protein
MLVALPPLVSEFGHICPLLHKLAREQLAEDRLFLVAFFPLR